jgi:hypothetical protein
MLDELLDDDSDSMTPRDVPSSSTVCTINVESIWRRE